jgi:hypothetical protein
MGMVKRSNPPFWQTNLAPFGIFVVLGIALTAVLTDFDNTFQGRMSAYDAAKICTSALDVSGCRYQGPAHIVRIWTHSGNPAVDVAFDHLVGRVVSADLDSAFAAQWRTWEVNSVVNAELWDSRLVVVAGVRTDYNPDTFPAGNYVAAAFISGAVTLVLSALFVWWLVLYRRAARKRQAQVAIDAAEHPLATQQRPLTSEMTGFLQKEAAMAQHPFQVVLLILGLAAVIPMLFSVIFIVQGVLVNWGTAIIWSTFLALGGLTAWGVLHDTEQERRDLLGSIFARSIGPFSVKVTYSKAGTSVQVVVGGRTLSGNAVSLMSIESGSGTVDYLPISGDLLEVRDESGEVLWSRFAAAQRSKD